MNKNWAYLMLVGTALFWSGNFIVGRAFSTGIPPITLSYLRWCTALVIFLPFALRPMIQQWDIIRSNFGKLLFMGTIGVAGFNTFAYIGLGQTTATNALLINSFIPILIILLTRIYPGTPITLGKSLGILVSTCGVLFLVSRGNLTNLLAFNVNSGDLWVLLAAFFWATYSISLRWKPTALSPTAFLGFTMIVGVIVLSPIYWFNLLQEPAISINVQNMIAIAYIALFASIGAFLLWNHGVSMVGAPTAGQFIHLMPVFGTIMAVGFLGEQLHWFHLVGALAIASGILLSLREKQPN
jgi:drug/metabolite transporter (DMT)-like permease